MPKSREKTQEFIARMMHLYPGVFRKNDLTLYCIYCNCVVLSNKIFSIKQHLATRKHMNKAEEISAHSSHIKKEIQPHQKTAEELSEDEFLETPLLYEGTGMDVLTEELFENPANIMDFLKQMNSKLDKLLALEERSHKMKTEEHEAALKIKQIELEIKTIELNKLKHSELKLI